MSVMVSEKVKQVIRQNGTGKYTVEAFSFLSKKKDTSITQHGRISRGREKSHHALSYKPHSLET
jgi:hypothetical protein